MENLSIHDGEDSWDDMIQREDMEREDMMEFCLRKLRDSGLSALPGQQREAALRYLDAARRVEQQQNIDDSPGAAHTLAFDMLSMPDPPRTAITRAAFTPALLRRCVEAVQARENPPIGWQTLLVALGNNPSQSGAELAHDLVAAGAVPMLLSLLDKGAGWKTHCPTGSNALDTALWLTANLAGPLGLAQNELSALAPLVPSLRARLAELPRDADTPTQAYMRAFRALVALVPASALAEEARAYPWLLRELRCAIERKPIPDGSLYPDAFDRLYSVVRVAATPDGRAALVATGALPLLAQSLVSAHAGNTDRTLLQWRFAVEALHAFATSRDHYEQVRSYALPRTGRSYALPWSVIGRAGPHAPTTGELLAAVSGRRALPLETRRLAADAAIALRARWPAERVLWLAVLKNGTPAGDGNSDGDGDGGGDGDGDAACHLSRLPSELVRRVLAWMMLLEERDDDAIRLVDDPLVDPELLPA